MGHVVDDRPRRPDPKPRPRALDDIDHLQTRRRQTVIPPENEVDHQGLPAWSVHLLIWMLGVIIGVLIVTGFNHEQNNRGNTGNRSQEGTSR